jgi:hypothetical protein
MPFAFDGPKSTLAATLAFQLAKPLCTAAKRAVPAHVLGCLSTLFHPAQLPQLTCRATMAGAAERGGSSVVSQLTEVAPTSAVARRAGGPVADKRCACAGVTGHRRGQRLNGVTFCHRFVRTG